MRCFWFWSALLAVAPSLALAQVPERRPGLRPDERSRDELYKLVDAYVVSNLQESVGLSDEQFAKILPLVKRFQADRRGFAVKRQQITMEMRRSLEGGQATEARIAELLKDLRAVEAEEPTALRKDMEGLDAQLTTLQQAKLRLLLVQVEQRIRELRARGRQGPPGRMRRDRDGELPS